MKRHDCNITNPDRRPSSWSHQEGGIISPGHLPTLQPSSPSPHHCPSDLRPRSPSPPPRRMQTSIQGASRAHMHPDSNPSIPASSCALPEDRPIQAPEQSDLIQQNPASWYNAYRPSPSFPSEKMVFVTTTLGGVTLIIHGIKGRIAWSPTN
ncbi:hypothetical protein H4Q26_014099 [Puccinia striiformis f. sp. tritici PST-130]|nr:hypothetical protein H4Q26_014099 [Puccinia striiformis f. sp. tritici PST-130]